MTLRKALLLSLLLFAVVMVVASAVVYVSRGAAGVPATVTEVINGAGVARGFTVEDVVTGKEVSLTDYRGSVVLLNFVNYGCSQSISNVVSKELETIQSLERERTNFVPVSVFCGCCSADTLRDLAKKKGLDWPLILDSQNSIQAEYQQYIGQYGYPTLVVLGPDQKVKQVSNYADAATLSGMIDGALKN